MYCGESLAFPLDSMHDKHTKMFKEGVPHGPFGSKTHVKRPSDMMRYISEFSKRDLTMLEDKINAMRGIFHIFEHGSHPSYQLMGVPILPRFPYERAQKSAEERFVVGLTWYHSEPGRRVAHFPSWSWAGWTGIINPRLGFMKEAGLLLDRCRVWIEMDHGVVSQFPSLETFPDLALSDTLWDQKFIHVKANMFTCSTVHLDGTMLDTTGIPNAHHYIHPKAGEQYAKVVTKEGKEFYLKLILDRELEEFEKSGKQLIGILVGDVRFWDDTIIVVEEFSDGHAERLALSTLVEPKAPKRNVWSHMNREDTREWARTDTETRTIKLG
jgi:hypothetical protein